MAAARNIEAWTNLPIGRIEDLRDAVLGAGLEATQMSTGLLSGSLAFAQSNGIVYSSGVLNGQVALRGPLSQDLLTVGIGLRMGAGTRHWLEETGSGSVGVFHGGDEHDAFYTPGSLYATATLSVDRLEEVASDEELILDRRVLGGTGVHALPLGAGLLGVEHLPTSLTTRRRLTCDDCGCIGYGMILHRKKRKFARLR
jgi:hypothetical protein